MIHLYCCYTEAHAVLFREYFVPSLSNNVLVHALRLDIAGPGDFLSNEFLDCIRRKIDLIIDSVDRHAGDIIVWSDIDIVLFGDFEPEVRKLFDKRPDLDMVLQREGKHTSDVNSGFFAMRCGPRARRFFERVKETMLANPEKNEQPVVNELLFGDEDLVTWDYLPLWYVARSHNWPPETPMRLYHANCTAGADGIRQKRIQFADLKEYQDYATVKVCLVTPELVGPRRNSGIGTHAFYYSRHLARQPGHEVTVLLTAEQTVPYPEEGVGWEKHFREEHNIRLVRLQNEPPLYDQVGWFNQWFSLRSQQVYAWLRNKNFDIVHFQDLNADGFFTLQARETGVGFQKCAMTVTVNGPNLWARQGMKQFADSPVDDALINFCESYCLAKADMVLAPSEFALQWCRDQGWPLAERQQVAPYLIEKLEPVNQPGQPYAKPREIVFFGRLETRKGLLIFLKAIKRLHSEGKLNDIERLWLIGGNAFHLEFDSREIIYEFLTKETPGLPFTVEAYLDHHACLDFLRKHHEALVVTPSLTETLGYTVIESLELNLNIIATKGGAIPELFEDAARLCEPDAASLATLMGKALDGELPAPRKAYAPEKSLAAWQQVDETCQAVIQEKIVAMESLPGEPRISVCIPHFNYGPYLREQLSSLAAQTYASFDVVVLDDGSTETESQEIFAQLEKEYAADERFRFIKQDNAGLCAARNRLAKEAKADYIVFCDADNISEPGMLSALARAIVVSGADCVTCHMSKFRDDPESGRRKKLDVYTPLGPCLEAGPYCDPFGDANFIIRKAVFEDLGGFRHVPQTASEDWEFLAELCLRGYKLEVVPLPLFAYREHGESNMRQTPFFDTRMRTLQPYFERLGESWQRRLLYNAVGTHERQEALRRCGIVDKYSQEEIMTHRAHIKSLQADIEQAHRARRTDREALRKANPLLFGILKWLAKRKQGKGDS